MPQSVNIQVGVLILADEEGLLLLCLFFLQAREGDDNVVVQDREVLPEEISVLLTTQCSQNANGKAELLRYILVGGFLLLQVPLGK